MKMVVNLRLILYVLPTPLISKIPLELMKNKSDIITFQIPARVTWFMLWYKKSPRKKKLDEVSAVGIKSKLTMAPVKLLSGAH